MEKLKIMFELLLDIQKNKPVILKTYFPKKYQKKDFLLAFVWKEIILKQETKLRDYVYETSLITPYASITFDDPKGQKFSSSYDL